MPPFLPALYSDETLNSVIARYHLRSGNLANSFTYRDLFGRNIRKIDIMLPSNLNDLCKQIANEEFTVSELVENHTLYPFLVAFKSHNRNEMKKYMLEGNKRLNAFHSGVNQKNDRFHHCYVCIEEDRKIYGETYWHRIHQLPGVIVCPIHKKPLLRVKEEIMNNVDNNFILANQKEIYEYPDIKLINPGDLQLLNVYAKEAASCLNHFEYLITIGNLRELYKAKLKNNGFYIRYCINNKKLFQEFKNYFGDAFLNIMKSPLNNKQYRNSWIFFLLNQKKFFNTTRHILFIIFLFGSISSFIEFSRKYDEDKGRNVDETQIFGKGPWPCFNPAHTDYLKNSITEVKLKNSNYEQVFGVFECSCGMVYSKKANTNNDNNAVKILKYGSVWENKLKDLMEEGMSQISIAKELKVSRYIISKYAKMENGNNQEYEILLNSKRDQWLELLRESTNVTSNTKPGLYRWLKRNDEEWLKNHFPKNQIKKHIEPQKRIDWKKRDLAILNEIKEIMKNWCDVEVNKPLKRTMVTITKQTKSSHNIIIHNKSRLPNTIKYITSVIEDSNQYAWRKIDWAYKEMQRDNEKINIRELLRKSGTNKASLVSKYYYDISD